MKARFTEIPKELTTYVDGSIVYYQIALNPQKVEENDPETDQTRTEYECDFNSSLRRTMFSIRQRSKQTRRSTSTTNLKK